METKKQATGAARSAAALSQSASGALAAEAAAAMPRGGNPARTAGGHKGRPYGGAPNPQRDNEKRGAPGAGEQRSPQMKKQLRRRRKAFFPEG